MTAYLLAAGTFASTMIGGLAALRWRSRLQLFMGFAAGVLLGVVAFELLPEIIEQVRSGVLASTPIMAALVGAFLLFHVLEKLLLIHHGHEEHYVRHHHPEVGVLSALALASHSFMDGAAIGLGFRVGGSVGGMVALAVIAHDFTDGMNTVTLMLSHENSPARARRFLLLDAVAPLVGVASVQFFTAPPAFLALYLGFFAGFLLYISTSDILPEAHSEKSSPVTIALTVAGALFAFAASRLV
jgi:zinc transporter ZupT